MDSRLAAALNDRYLFDEDEVVAALLAMVRPGTDREQAITVRARTLVEAVRARPDHLSPLERFLTEYDLSTEEGVLLMCLAETLLRIPDTDTADLLIADKIKEADWEDHLGSRDLLVNASTWGLMLTGHLLPAFTPGASPRQLWVDVVSRTSGPVIRNAILLAMRIIGDQFVLGETIKQALTRAGKSAREWEAFSFDMLGEAALTRADAGSYLDAYLAAIDAIGEKQTGTARFSISVKLSALCPRFEVRHWDRACRELTCALLTLAKTASQYDLQLTVDAEESDRLELTLAVFDAVLRDPACTDWQGLGLAVQTYQKRALPVIDYLAAAARDTGKMIPVRLVKGAYWDTEIKLSQVQGLSGFPVFTRKCNTDVSFQAAVLKLAQHKGALFPQFATHNAYSVAWVQAFFAPGECEFQRLHGMGETLYRCFNDKLETPYRCRIYAPVGDHDALLPYLVRRLLENGANTSFVHRIADASVPVETIITAPAVLAESHAPRHGNPAIALPRDLFGSERINSPGCNFADRREVAALMEELKRQSSQRLHASPLPADSELAPSGPRAIRNPATGQVIGEVHFAGQDTVAHALDKASGAWREWEQTPAAARAALLEKTADLIQEHRAELIGLCIRETGKTILDAHNDVREAVDFLRYYAAGCRRLFAQENPLPGPVGESNTLQLRGKGMFFCISPWNFPVAIFTGQVAAALAAGNTVLAKPAEQASATAMAVIRLFHAAGIPENVLTFLPGDGPAIARQVLADPRLAGVAFTGSTVVARDIARKLAAGNGAITTLIAETGGINAMLVDSSALPEQVVKDVVASAFNSAGQRCSALRVLFLQEDVADRVIGLIRGCMDELSLGDPALFETDIGPVIDADARDELRAHIDKAVAQGRLLHQVNAGGCNDKGYFVAPALIRIDRLGDLQKEVFGPVLHIIRYRADRLMAVCDDINASGYALTFGIHSRITHRIDAVCRRIRAGNVYINRNMIGAVVGSQPFGGNGLSGTGPKAGGPHYLARFANEQTVSQNTAAIGGDPAMFASDE